MKGLIMAAGIGSRLAPLTDNKPKCLVEIKEEFTILDSQLKALMKVSIRDVIIITGYKSEILVSYLNEKYVEDFNFTFINNDIYETSNNMYSFYLSKDLLCGENFISMNADVAIDENLLEAILLNDKKNSKILVDSSQYMEESMKVIVSEDGFVKKISKQIDEEIAQAVSIDIYYFNSVTSKKLFYIIENLLIESLVNWFEVALDINLSEDEIIPIDISDSKWVEIDNLDDLSLAKKVFEND